MEIININNALRLPLEIDARKIFKGKKTEIVFLSLAAGQSLDKHDNPVHVIFYVLNGHGSIKIADVDYEVKSGDCFSVSPGILRAWCNCGEEELQLLVVKEL